MKNNKGITLISLTIYLIILMIVIVLMSNISGYFFENINQITKNEAGEEEYLKFTVFLSKDIDKEDLTLISNGIDENDNRQYLICSFKNGDMHQYILYNSNLYYINIDNDGNITKKIHLCKNVTGNNIFEFDNQNNKLAINFAINGKNYNSSFNVNI